MENGDTEPETGGADAEAENGEEKGAGPVPRAEEAEAPQEGPSGASRWLLEGTDAGAEAPNAAGAEAPAADLFVSTAGDFPGTASAATPSTAERPTDQHGPGRARLRRGERKARRQAENRIGDVETLEARVAQAEARLDTLHRLHSRIEEEAAQAVRRADTVAEQGRRLIGESVQRVVEEAAADARSQFSAVTAKLQQDATARFSDMDTLAQAGRALSDEVSASRAEVTAATSRMSVIESTLTELGGRADALERRLTDALDARDRAAGEQLATALKAERESFRQMLEDRFAQAEAAMRTQRERVDLMFAERRSVLAPIEARLEPLEQGMRRDAARVEKLQLAVENLERQVLSVLTSVETLQSGLQTIAGEVRGARLGESETRLRGLERSFEKERAERATAIEGMRSSLAAIEEAIARIEFSTERPAPPVRQSAPREALDINGAAFEDLRAFGLSVTQAARLIAFRDARGGFTSLGELDGLSGFPEEQIDELKRRARL